MRYGVVYQPQGAFRECTSEAEARNVFENAPQGDDQTAVLIVDYVEVDSRGLSSEEEA